MGSWIVVAVQLALSLVTLAVAVLAFIWARSASKEGREARRMIEELIASFHKSQEEAAARPSYPSAVNIGGEIVPLDAELIARLNAVTDKASERGGIEALYEALARGLGAAERELGAENKGSEPRGPEEKTGQVVPLRPRGKPPGGGEGGAA
jgi:hypothetical protein